MAAIVEKLRTQHRVACQQGMYRSFQAGRINPVTVEFVVEVRGHTAQRLARGTADPVRVLHGRQLEGQAVVRTVIEGRRGSGRAVKQRQPGAQAWVGHQLGETCGQALASPLAGEADQGDGIQPPFDQVGLQGNLVGGLAQGFGQGTAQQCCG